MTNTIAEQFKQLKHEIFLLPDVLLLNKNISCSSCVNCSTMLYIKMIYRAIIFITRLRFPFGKICSELLPYWCKRSRGVSQSNLYIFVTFAFLLSLVTQCSAISLLIPRLRVPFSYTYRCQFRFKIKNEFFRRVLSWCQDKIAILSALLMFSVFTVFLLSQFVVKTSLLHFCFRLSENISVIQTGYTRLRLHIDRRSTRLYTW